MLNSHPAADYLERMLFLQMVVGKEKCNLLVSDV